MPVKIIQSLVILCVCAAMMAVAGSNFNSLYEREPVVKGPGVTKVAKLSDYFPGIKGTVADTDV
jgi:hypothetical protein